jgi:triosephosphate isomerase
MEMTVTQSLDYLLRFQALAGDLLERVQVLLFPPYTALYAMAQVLGNSPIELGAQTVSDAAGGAYTGEVSARLVADAGARWVQLGHWELRRHLGETDQVVNQKVLRALEAGLRVKLLIGEGRDVGPGEVSRALDRQLTQVLAGCTAMETSGMVFVYEPEWTIGVAEPASPEHVEAGCRVIRCWLADHYGSGAAQAVRLIYGGSVSPVYAHELLALPNVDGLGAGRIGRDPVAFAEIVDLIAKKRPRHENSD